MVLYLIVLISFSNIYICYIHTNTQWKSYVRTYIGLVVVFKKNSMTRNIRQVVGGVTTVVVDCEGLLVITQQHYSCWRMVIKKK